MILLALATALLLTDPAGDVPPPGYAWPQAAVYQEVGFADLVGFRVEKKQEGLAFGFRLDRTPNPGRAPLGFSLAVLAVYLDTGPGGLAVLPGAGFPVAEDAAADRAVVVSGWGALLYDLKTGRAVPVPARRQGDWIVVQTPLPPGRDRYYPVSGLYDPFAPYGFRRTQVGGGIWAIRAPPQSPNAVDVFDPGAYRRGWLRPARPPGPSPRRLAVGLLAGLSGVLVAWGGVGAVRARREARRGPPA